MDSKDRLYQKKPGGSWYGWYYDATGKCIYFCTRCKDRRAAVAALKQREREAFSPRRASANPAAHTTEEALKFLVGESSADRSPSTIDMYARKGGHLLRLLGDVDVNALKLDDIQRYINTRQTEGAKNGTIYKEICTLRKALTVARGRGLYSTDPRTIFPSFSNKYTPKRRFLTSEELAVLLANLAEKRHLYVLVSVYLGTRLSEAFSLSWSDVNLEQGWVLVSGTKTDRSRRMVPIPPVLRVLLKQHRQKAGRVLEPWSNIRRDLQVACDNAGIERVTPNDLRRTFASWLKQAGVDSFTVAKLMGHTSSRMVELVYGHLNDVAFINAVKRLPALPTLPEPGSKWVVNSSGAPETGETDATPQPEESWCSAVPRAGIEPATRGFSVPCSTN
jgi:integrase